MVTLPMYERYLKVGKSFEGILLPFMEYTSRIRDCQTQAKAMLGTITKHPQRLIEKYNWFVIKENVVGS